MGSSANKKINPEKKTIISEKKFIENRDNRRVTWQIINETIGRKTNNIDDNLIRDFKNRNINELLNDFAMNFEENVNKIIHNCNIQTMKSVKIVCQNSLYLDYRNKRKFVIF